MYVYPKDCSSTSDMYINPSALSFSIIDISVVIGYIRPPMMATTALSEPMHNGLLFRIIIISSPKLVSYLTKNLVFINENVQLVSRITITGDLHGYFDFNNRYSLGLLGRIFIIIIIISATYRKAQYHNGII